MERYGSGIFLGSGIDERFGFSVEVRYADKNMAESYNCIPTTGRLPEKENEAAVSSIILEALGVPQKLGEEVTLTREVNPEIYDFLEEYHLECQLVTDGELRNMDRIPDVDYRYAHAHWKQRREASLEYLKNALGKT